MMGSDSLFNECKDCGTAVSKSAKACPKCGANQKKLKVVHWIGIILLGFIIIGIINTPDSQPTAAPSSASSNALKPLVKEQSAEPEIPEDQAQFIQIITDHAVKFKTAKNELQQSAIRDQRKEAISASLNSYSVTSWVGTIHKLATNSDGKAILSVRITSDIEVKTWNNALSDIGSNTLIEKGTPVFDSLFDLSKGQRVKFSGTFLASNEDFIDETSMTIRGSMRSPEFVLKFKSVTPISEGKNGTN